MDIEDSITQLEEVFEGQPWFGPSILKSLKDIPVEFWDKKPEYVSHSITELVYHMMDWRVFVIEKLKDNESFGIELNSEKDWRRDVLVQTEVQKETILNELIKTQELICELLTTKPDSWMYENSLGNAYKNDYMIRGMIQHDIYHLGQINSIYSQLN
ncbi:MULTISPECIES: DinB family protein [Aquimarina]|uniref:DinB family protein n=1 Tax=Aquimarina algiphila TaxID=2047982 RepID=A0A554VNJ2_9FLAO|nr:MULTISPECIES: DinB family protein [Aquimarina]TSE09935.1 DinB family protein [Aquimarina algiphila]